jgi:hypothetical protein
MAKRAALVVLAAAAAFALVAAEVTVKELSMGLEGDGPPAGGNAAALKKEHAWLISGLQLPAACSTLQQ